MVDQMISPETGLESGVMVVLNGTVNGFSGFIHDSQIVCTDIIFQGKAEIVSVVS